jgi:hypothetical protein
MVRSRDPQRGQVALLAVLATVCVAVASFASTLLVSLGCISSATTAQCRETKGGKIGLIEALLLFGPPAMAAIVGATAVWRRQLPAILLATAVLLPLAILLPPLAWE